MLRSLSRTRSAMSKRTIVPGENTKDAEAQAEKLSKLRALLTSHSVDAYVVVSEDEHASEYIADADKRREYLSGFTGSAGTAIVSQKDALLFTDGRYHQQASQQLSAHWTLHKHGLPGVKSWQEHLTGLENGSRIGFDPKLISMADYNSLTEELRNGTRLVPVAQNLVDAVWGDHKPARPALPVIVHDERYSGETTRSKLDRLETHLGPEPWGIVVSALDEIAYVLNLRGSDIPFNPVFFAYLVIRTVPGRRQVTLFVNEQQLGDDVKRVLSAADVALKPYEEVVPFLQETSHELESEKRKLVVPSRSSYALAVAAGLTNICIIRSPLTDLKAVKNSVQIEGFRQCHCRDGVAVTRYLAWLKQQLAEGAKLREYDAALQLEKFRSEGDLFVGLSFETISSTGPNASIIHYKPSETDSAFIDKDQVYLVDSGAQYYDGTTDVTRTVHFGTPTAEEIDAYTRVLQGVIAIETAIFPVSVSGFTIDAFARRALWQNGLDFGHGTGHGIGHFLNVHEGPMGIGTRIAYNDVKLAVGHILSNEPGFYKDGSFGIRTENVVVVQKAMSKLGREFNTFESLTVVPIATNLVDKSLLTPAEVAWLNKYNHWVRETLSPRLLHLGDTLALEYLKAETKPI